mmetsp:Transcript_101287/g.326885  ORF Transcript_101287/g.326885 Transcript_101287/m.326885 type:complete len:204 (+) Transcript_101287:705-1316(+)
MMPLMSSRYLPSMSRKTSGSRFSAMVVKPAMSLKKTLTSALATPSRAWRLLCTRSCTTCGSMYLEKDCRPLDMWQKASRIWAISQTSQWSVRRPVRRAGSERPRATQPPQHGGAGSFSASPGGGPESSSNCRFATRRMSCQMCFRGLVMARATKIMITAPTSEMRPQRSTVRSMCACSELLSIAVSCSRASRSRVSSCSMKAV